MRDTSLLAYQDLKPKLGKLETAVLDLVKNNPYLTDKELAQIAPHLTEANVRCRRIELTNRGLIKSSGKRRCTVTGNQAHTWKATP